MFMLKHCRALELSEVNCNAHSAIQHNCWTVFVQWHYHHIVHWREDIYSGHTEETAPNICTCINQEERRHNKMPAHTIDVQLVTKSINRWVASTRQYTDFIHVDHRIKVSEAYSCNSMPVTRVSAIIHHISNKFFIFQRYSVSVHRTPEAINFLTCNTRCWSILKILSNQT